MLFDDDGKMSVDFVDFFELIGDPLHVGIGLLIDYLSSW